MILPLEDVQMSPPMRYRIAVLDLLICALIVSLSGVPFFLYERSPGFLYDDVSYHDLAEALLHQHSYSTNLEAERVQPPGLAVILASLCQVGGCSHDTQIRAMAVFFALGLLMSY